MPYAATGRKPHASVPTIFTAAPAPATNGTLADTVPADHDLYLRPNMPALRSSRPPVAPRQKRARMVLLPPLHPSRASPTTREPQHEGVRSETPYTRAQSRPVLSHPRGAETSEEPRTCGPTQTPPLPGRLGRRVMSWVLVLHRLSCSYRPLWAWLISQKTGGVLYLGPYSNVAGASLGLSHPWEDANTGWDCVF